MNMQALLSATQYALAWIMLGCLALQMPHCFLRIMHSNPRVRTQVTVYESAILAHMAAMSMALVFGAHHNYSSEFPAFEGALPLSYVPWINLPIAIVTLWFGISSPRDSGEPRFTNWMPFAETLISACYIPPVFSSLWEWREPILLVNAFYFAARTAFLLACDINNRRRIVSPLSAVEALRRLPEGVLYIREKKRLVFENDTMRRCLSSLGVSANTASAESVWEAVVSKQREIRSAAPPPSIAHHLSDDQAILRIGPDELRLFTRRGVSRTMEGERPTQHPDGGRSLPADASSNSIPSRYAQILAFDVTEKMKVIEEIGRANTQLAASQRKLRASVEITRKAADNEALLRMRGRIHDIIGQRLSLLHRALEDDDMSDEKLRELKPLLEDILDDLAADLEISARDELAATIDAFALAGVSIHVDGELPADETHAKLFADCIREAATNAVRHAGAQNVSAMLRHRELEISNDGTQPTGPIQEGTGLSSMRRAVTAAGGTLRISRNPLKLNVKLESEGA